MNKIAGICILYNPENNIYENINSYINNIDRLYIIDNSLEKKQNLLNSINSSEKIIYFHHPENIGIGKAINLIAKLSLENNFKFLLTMDQDSYFENGSFKKLIEFINNNDTEEIAIYSPIHYLNKNTILPKNDFDYLEIVMTSGNIIRLNAWLNINGFNEELFIDHVDHDYCFRLIEKSYKIIRYNKSVLIHKLGETTIFIKLGKKQIDYREYSPIRIYYMFRNGFYIIHKYKKISPKSINEIKSYLYLMLFRNIPFYKTRFICIKLIVIAYIHYRRNRFGKFKY